MAASKRKQQNKRKQIYEPYWTEEAVNNGIKRGELIVGPIRISHNEYEDAFVPSTDGKRDIYIEGRIDRNRALNSDVVVVQLYPYTQWKVHLKNFEHYERTVSASNLEALDDVGDSKAGNSIESSGSDSDPDVEVEDNDGKEVLRAKGSKNVKIISAMNNLDISNANTVSQHGTTRKKSPMSLSSDKVSQAVLNVEDTNNKAKSAPRKINKFASVSDMVENGSPLAKNLFSVEKGSNASSGEVNSSKFVHPKGKVVYISEKKHSRAAIGRIKLLNNGNESNAIFCPCDSRVPRIIIPMTECPKDFHKRSEDFANTLFIARITYWYETYMQPKGTLAESLGEAGQIEPETNVILFDLSVDDTPFSDEVNQCLPKDLPWKIPKSEFSNRRDLRKSCVFTIDPATSRDLDDAMSIEELGDGRYEVGVHVADVSYFVKEGTELDLVASKRAKSVYLVQKEIPMLPRLLCEELCSLNPNEDRLTFSVIWIIDEKGKIYDEWYGRSVIRSCVKLSYDHAQGFIEQPEKKWIQAELPPITNSFTVQDVMKRVLLLNKIAVNLRKQRFHNGVLSLDKVELQYILNSKTGLPNKCFVNQQKDSNRLIEEFMLLANKTVAHKIKKSFPDKSILIRQPPPQSLQAVEELCKNYELQISTTSAGDLQHSLRKYYGEDARLPVLIELITKLLQRAMYFCSGELPDEAKYHHYAMNEPLYTNFTSPIRCYPDIMVHRLLAASLGYSSITKKPSELLQKEADHCNYKNRNAKKAYKRSSGLYFAIFVKEAGPLEVSGMVMAVLYKSFDVLILQLGVVKRVYLKSLPVKSSNFRKNMKCPELVIEWEADGRVTRHLIRLFTSVDCIISAEKEPLKLSCIIRRPKEEITSASKQLDVGDDNDI